MGIKADLTVQVGLWQGLAQSVGSLLGIEVDVDHSMDGQYMAHLFTRFSSAIDSMRKLASAAADISYHTAGEIDSMRRTSPLEAGPPVESAGGTYRSQSHTAIVRADQEQPQDDGDLGDTDLELLREENGNLRLSLQEKMDALSQAHLVLNRITAAAGIDRWTPDGQQVVDKVNKLQGNAKPAKPSYYLPSSLVAQAKQSLVHLRNARALGTIGAEGVVSAIDSAIILLTAGLDSGHDAVNQDMASRVNKARPFLAAAILIVRELESEGAADIGTLRRHVADAITSLEGL